MQNLPLEWLKWYHGGDRNGHCCFDFLFAVYWKWSRSNLAKATWTRTRFSCDQCNYRSNCTCTILYYHNWAQLAIPYLFIDLIGTISSYIMHGEEGMIWRLNVHLVFVVSAQFGPWRGWYISVAAVATATSWWRWYEQLDLDSPLFYTILNEL